MDVEVSNVRGKGTSLFPSKPSKLLTEVGRFGKNSESSVTASQMATPSSDLSVQVGLHRDEQEVRGVP